MDMKSMLSIHKQIEQENLEHFCLFKEYSGKTVREVLEKIGGSEPNAPIWYGSDYGTQFLGEAKGCVFNLYAAGRWAKVKRIRKHKNGYEIIFIPEKSSEDLLIQREGVSLWEYN